MMDPVVSEIGETWFRDWPVFWRGLLIVSIRDIAIVLGAWVVGAVAARILAGWLGLCAFDEIWTPPWSARGPDSRRPRKAGASPTQTARLLVTLSGVACGLYWVADLHGWEQLGAGLGQVVSLTWKIVLLSIAALFVSRLLAGVVVDLLSTSQIRGAIENLFPSESDRTDSSLANSVTRAAGTFVYCMIFTLLFLVAADLFRWASLRSALLALWDLGLHLATATAVLVVGGVGIKHLFPGEAAVSPTRHTAPASQTGALPAPGSSPKHAPSTKPLVFGLVLIIALGVLASHAFSAMSLFVFLVLVLVGVFAFRDYLPDLFAGIILHYREITTVTLDGKPAVLARRGLLASEWERDGVVLRKPNKRVLDALRREENPGEGSQ